LTALVEAADARSMTVTDALCPLCRAPLQALGQIPIRTGGKEGASAFFFGEWAELGERILPLDLYRCTRCGRLELYDHDFSLPLK